MADNTEGPPFKFTAVTDNIGFTCTSYGGSKKSKISVSAGIYQANSSVPRLPGESQWKDIVYAEKYNRFLTLHALQARLSDPERRKEDYNTLKNQGDNAQPLELWDSDGTFGSIPPRLIFTNKDYDAKVDEAQLRIWQNVANNLGGKPPENINPKYGRFSLRPSDTLKAKTGLLYCTPAESPVFGVTTTKLETIIAANTGKFNGWPDPIVVDFKTAKGMGLKLVGQNFLQFYFVWMKVEDYAELWKQFGVTELLHALPAEGVESTYKGVDKILKGSRGGPVVDGATTEISSKTLGATNERKTTQSIMGESATTVADKLWGKNFITSGMGKSVKVEWLHRVAFALGGPDTFKNLVFGTWECNTNMIRVENMVTELTKKADKGVEYKGRLTTVNNTAKTLSRFRLAKANTDATAPSWANNYSWLCFSLNYRYVMGADKCPLNGGVAHDIYFDPWSIYVPLSIEPRLDIMILQDLKSGGSSTTHAITKRSAVGSVVGSVVGDVQGVLGGVGSLLDAPVSAVTTDTYEALAWTAATTGLPVLELPDMTIRNPSISPDDGSRSKRSIPIGAPPENGFVLQGEVNVFGTSVVGNLEKWFGPAPDGVNVGADPPLIERVAIPEDFHMSMLIPLLGGTPFDKIIFRNVSIYHQNYVFDKTKSIGWHFNADWVIDSSCGLLYDILTKALQVNKPVLSIHASFGDGLHWNTPLDLHSFILEGVFSDLTLSPVSGLTLTAIGVRLLGIRGFSFSPEPHSTLSFGFGIFGKMVLNVPGSIVPLNLDYEMGLVGGTVNLLAEVSGSIWEDALGVKGLLLEDVAFGTTFSTSSPWKTFAFDVSATFSFLSSQAYLRGSYAAGGHFSLTAELDNFGINEIDDLFYTLFSDFLTLPDFDVHVGSAIISVVSGQGLSVSLLDVEVAGYAAVSVSLSLSSSGVFLSGALSNSRLTFGDVELRDALIKLSFRTGGQKKKVDLMLGGTLAVDFLNLAVGAVVHLYPGARGVEWAVVAQLSAPNKPFALSDVVPAVKGSFVDFALSNVVIIAASQDDPLVSQSFPGYNVRKGVQVFAVIDRIPALHDLLHEDVKGLVLDAGWSKASGFNLMVSLPVESSIDLGNGIKTTPITLGIRTSPIELAIMAGVTVPVKDSTPLDFSFVLAGNATGASASAQMQGWWVKPFGIDNLKIGPEVTLSIEIVYAQFAATGTPSGFGVSGGLMIGSIEAFLAMNVSEDPKRELLYGEVKNLDISDVVTFAGTLLQEDIPKIPDNMLKFEELKVYICPFGVVLGKTVYPQGFSFKADLLLFGKRANVECTIDKAQKSVSILGGLDKFQLGPLTVSGTKGPSATLECTVGVYKQQLIVDGAVSIFDAQAQTYINIQFLPDPIFKFFMMLKFADVFMFKVDAKLLGSIRDPLSGADFSLDAEFENDILEYIAQQVLELFEAAKVAATEGLEAAQAKVDAAEKQWLAMIADAENKVAAAQKDWVSYKQKIRDSSEPVIDHYLAEITRLEGEIDKARKDFDNALESAERAVNQANVDRAAALASAERDVEKAKRDADNAIDEAQRKLNDAEEDLSRAFGNAERDVDEAQKKVDRLQRKIDGIKKVISECEQASGWEFWKKFAIPGLWLAVGAVEAEKGIATLGLETARGILEGAEYVAKKDGIGLAREALKVAKATADATLSAANGAVELADTTSKAAVDAAEATLEGVKKGTEFIAFQGAIGALEAFKTANKAAYEAAIAAIDGVMDSAEFIAFNAAKAGLEVAKGSTAVLDAAKEALVLAEKASQAALSILEQVVKFASRALNIKTVILSGTLRGVLGIGGANARPFSAAIKGYILGQSFDIRVKFDPRKSATFISAIFKLLWDMVSSSFVPNLSAIPSSVVKREAVDDASILAARSKFLKQRPDVLKILAAKSESMPDIPLGPFSGNPMVPPLVVATKTLILMEEQMGISVFDDLKET